MYPRKMMLCTASHRKLVFLVLLPATLTRVLMSVSPSSCTKSCRISLGLVSTTFLVSSIIFFNSRHGIASAEIGRCQTLHEVLELTVGQGLYCCLGKIHHGNQLLGWGYDEIICPIPRQESVNLLN